GGEIWEFCRRGGRALEPVICISLHERQVGTRRIAAFGQGRLKLEKPTRLEGIRRARTHIADLQHFPRLLRINGKRRGRTTPARLAAPARGSRRSRYGGCD